MTPQQQALAYRFVLGLVITEIPVLTAVLSSPTPDYRLLAIGLLGGLATALEKLLAPQVANVIAPNATVMVPEPPAPPMVLRP
ncbi:MAG TPA: hypothetical protein VNG04_07480 [Candidatus Acidoferrum sp.]|nr:hypothetical protein [Candidatus Acidoferrum sp.]HXJ32348.1 hypothetical protein [Gemmatimonadales bacterium]